MLIPTFQLILCSALLLPAALLAGVSHVGLMIAIGLYGLLLLVALGDAWAIRRRRGRIEMTLDPVTRTAKDRPTELLVTLHRTSDNPGSLWLALEWPASIEGDQTMRRIHWPGQAETCTVTWPCVPRQRGIFTLTRAVLETSSPARLWRMRETLALTGEIRVYPDLSRDKSKLSHWFLPRHQVGIHAQRWLGKGHEFEKLREYQPGDCFEDIHWKATAKHNQPITKEFQIERTQEVTVVLDTSRLSAQPLVGDDSSSPSEPTVLERYVTAASLLSMACVRCGDQFGLITFSDRIGAFVRARTGRAHQQTCQRVLCQVQSQRVMPDYAEIFTFMRTRLRKRSLILLLTDLRDPVQAEECQRGLRLLTRQHVLLVAQIIPSGIGPLFDSEFVGSHQDIRQRLSGHLQWQRLRQCQIALQRQGVAFHCLTAERLVVDLINHYVTIKQRQLL